MKNQVLTFTPLPSVGWAGWRRPKGISREMLEAGLDVYYQFDREWDNTDRIVCGIYEAMRAAKKKKGAK